MSVTFWIVVCATLFFALNLLNDKINVNVAFEEVNQIIHANSSFETL